MMIFDWGKSWERIKRLGLVVVIAAIMLTLAMMALTGQQTKAAVGGIQTNKFSSANAPGSPPTFEIYTWWTNPGEIEAMTALTAAFLADYPSVNVVLLDDYSELHSRLQSGTPPGSFHTHVGWEMTGWVTPDYLAPITQLWKDEGWLVNKFPDDLINLASYQGKLYAVPLNIHRGNVLWCNKSIFATHSLTVPQTFEEFFIVADQLQTAGVTTTLALGDKELWPAAHLFETILLGTLGPDDFRKLWTNKVPFTDPRVIEALEIFDQMMGYVNANHTSLDWAEATQLMIDGEAAMMIMGDWVDGYFRAQGWQPDVDYCWGPAPNTDGSSMLISDSFVQPANLPDTDFTLSWLRLLGSVEVQDQFNPLKGSAPARLDANSGLYSEYIQWSMSRIKTEELPPSMVHGSAAPGSFIIDANDIISNFIATQDVTATAEALQQAAINADFQSLSPPAFTVVITADSGMTQLIDLVQELTTTVEIPPNTVTTTTQFTLTIEPAILPPHAVSDPSLDYAHYAFTLNATQEDGTPVSESFNKPITVTIHYNPVGLVEDQLFIYYWEGSQWRDAATTCDPSSTYKRGQYFVSVAICHLTDFGLFEKSANYLPIILKNN